MNSILSRWNKYIKDQKGVDFLGNESIWPNRSDWILIAFYWSIAAAMIGTDYYDDFPWPIATGALIFNIFIDTLMVWVVVFILIPRFLGKGRYVLFFPALAIWVIFMGGVYNMGYEVFFDPYSIEITFMQAFNDVPDHLDSYAFLGILMVGKKMFAVQKRYLTAEKERRENELRMLKAQIDPHFLFNNLNILDVLIPRDPDLARAFLRRLSGLYRYLLRHKDEDVVSLNEEMGFCEGYLFLLKQRFDTTYQFEQNIQVTNPDAVFLPPGAVQTLIENVVKHNRASDEEPVQVSIEANDQHLRIANNLQPKLSLPESTGVGLSNLRARYALLTDRTIEVKQNEDCFSVALPLLTLTNE